MKVQNPNQRRTPMKRLLSLFLVSLFAFLFLGLTPLQRANVQTISLTNASTVQKSKKWAIAEFQEKGLAMRVNDTSGTAADSAGFTMQLWGFVLRSAPSYNNTLALDSCRLGFSGIANLLTMTGKTAANTAQDKLDTAIVVATTAQSNAIDGKMDIAQISPICCVDSVQAWFYPNAQTKKASYVLIDIGLVQVNPHAQNN